jgi:general secretion pathway protein A
MDSTYWGFSRKPFQRQGVVDDSSVGEIHEEALARLLFLIDEGHRYGLVTGAAGTGKTRLFRQIGSYARRQGRWCLEIDATGMGSDELTWQLADQMLTDCDAGTPPSRCWMLIQQQLVSRALVGQPIVILVDNLDLIDTNGFRVLQRLRNLADSVGADLTILMSTRSTEKSGAILDDIELTVELAGWSPQETTRFVADSLSAVGARTDVFTPEAIAILQEVTHGVPADVVRVCEFSMLAAMVHDRHDVDATIVKDVIAELLPQRWSTIASDHQPVHAGSARGFA